MSAIATSEEEIQITWAAPEARKQNGKLTGYRVFVVERNDPNSKEVKDVSASQLSVRVDNLKQWTFYKVSVLAYNKMGDGPPSKNIDVRTDEGGR